MPIPQFPGAGLSSLDDVINYVVRLERELRFLMESGLDSTNMFEVGGWRVKPGQFAYKDNMVGMSSAGTAATSIRFWAGNADPTIAPFRVQHDGKLFASNADIAGKITAQSGTIGGFTIDLTKLSGAGIIEGGTVRTAASGTRIELSGNSLKTYNSSGNLNGFAWGTDTSSATYGDAFLYNDGAKALEFFNSLVDGYSIYPATGYSMRLGISGRAAYGRGDWDMTNTFKVNSGTAFNTISQSDSTAADVATLKNDFNTLLSNLRAINVLA